MQTLTTGLFLAPVDKETAKEWEVVRNRANPTLAPKWNMYHNVGTKALREIGTSKRGGCC